MVESNYDFILHYGISIYSKSWFSGDGETLINQYLCLNVEETYTCKYCWIHNKKGNTSIIELSLFKEIKDTVLLIGKRVELTITDFWVE